MGWFDPQKYEVIKKTVFWFETVSEDEESNFKRLKMLSETKYTNSFSNNFSKRYEVFLFDPYIYCT